MTSIDMEKEFQRYSILHEEMITNMVDAIFRWLVENDGTRVHLKKRRSSFSVVKEEDPQVRSIDEASTSVTGAIGVAERGPVGRITA